MDLLKRIPLLLSVIIFIIVLVITKLFRFSIEETLIRLAFLVPIFYAAGYILRSYIEGTSLEDDRDHLDVSNRIEGFEDGGATGSPNEPSNMDEATEGDDPGDISGLGES